VSEHEKKLRDADLWFDVYVPPQEVAIRAREEEKNENEKPNEEPEDGKSMSMTKKTLEVIYHIAKRNKELTLVYDVFQISRTAQLGGKDNSQFPGTHCGAPTAAGCTKYAAMGVKAIALKLHLDILRDLNRELNFMRTLIVNGKDFFYPTQWHC
jgi:hypothetical protein